MLFLPSLLSSLTFCLDHLILRHIPFLSLTTFIFLLSNPQSLPSTSVFPLPISRQNCLPIPYRCPLIIILPFALPIHPISNSCVLARKKSQPYMIPSCSSLHPHARRPYTHFPSSSFRMAFHSQGQAPHTRTGQGGDQINTRYTASIVGIFMHSGITAGLCTFISFILKSCPGKSGLLFIGSQAFYECLRNFCKG